MQKILWNDGWTFFEKVPFGDWGVPEGEGTPVTLPHDYSIGLPRWADSPAGASGAFAGGEAAGYRKTFSVPQDWQGSTLMLQFDGAYMNADVYVNGNLVKKHHYGYTPFTADFTDAAIFGGENTVFVKMSCPMPSSRWYSGAGLYRHVYLLRGKSAYIEPCGLYVRTQSLTPQSAVLALQAAVCGTPDQKAQLCVELYRSDGICAAMQTTQFTGGKQTPELSLKVENPLPWSVEKPYLYTLKAGLTTPDGTLLDSCSMPFGIRTVSCSAATGLLLNGVETKLRGGCVHHDNGPLGAMAFDRAEQRRVELLKASGFNAVRCAHNPPSQSFLDACDRLGMLVIDEFFDCWRIGKNPYDYHLYFEDDWQRDIAATVLRDRNHPSVIIWSTGNEIPERTGKSGGYALARQLAGFVRTLDDRPVTNAGCGFGLEERGKTMEDWMALTRDFFAPLDIAGMNYFYENYALSNRLFPNRVICGTETFPLVAYETWQATCASKNVIGDFVWTSFDYLGEAGIGRAVYDGGTTGGIGDYPWNQAWCGDITVCGEKRPQSYYRDAVWQRTAAPAIFVLSPQLTACKEGVSAWGWPDVTPCWDFAGMEGQDARVEIYTCADTVTLYRNEECMGTQKVQQCKAVFTVPYLPGTLRAVANKDGSEFVSELCTPTAPFKLRLTPETAQMNAGGQDLCYVKCELVDARGHRVTSADEEISFTVQGAAQVFAAGSDNPKSEEAYLAQKRCLYRGFCLCVLRSTAQKGEAVLTACSPSFGSAQASLASL